MTAAFPVAVSSSPTSGLQPKGSHARTTPEPLWVPTAQASLLLGISRKTLFRLKKEGILKPERHWARKNPSRRCSDLLWHIQRCQLALGRA
jgi:hypothetical protein